MFEIHGCMSTTVGNMLYLKCNEIVNCICFFCLSLYMVPLPFYTL